MDTVGRSNNRKEHPNYPVDFKEHLVKEACDPGVSVSKLARRHGINANMLFKLPRDLREGLFAASGSQSAHLLPVLVQRVPANSASPSITPSMVYRDRHRQRSCPRPHRCCIPPTCFSKSAHMISLPAGTRIWIAAGITDIRAGMNGLVAKVETALAEDPYCGHEFVSRGRRGDMLKVLWWPCDGLCLLAKRLERGRFVWLRIPVIVTAHSGAS